MLLTLFFTPSIKSFYNVFDFYWYYPLYLFTLMFGVYKLGFKTVFINKYSYFVLFLFVLGIISKFLNPYPFIDLIKQIGGFILVGFTWFVFFKLNIIPTKQIFNIYLKICFILSLLTIPEQILHQFGVHLTPLKGGWLGLYRCYSICDEPFYFSLLITPSIIYYFNQKFNKTNLLILSSLFIGLFQTFSGAAWLGLMLYFLIDVFREKDKTKQLIHIVAILTLSFIVLSYHGTQKRIIETSKMFSYFPEIPPLTQLERFNTSSRSIYLNSVTTFEQLKNNPIIGGGIGSHKNTYNESIIKKIPDNTIKHYNVSDGASGIIRWISELGIVGLIFILFLLKKTIFKSNSIFRKSALVYWIIHLIHAGNFFSHGTFFWYFIINDRWFERNSNDKESKP